MIDYERLNQILTQYKANFSSWWDLRENGQVPLFKWKAVSHFQKNWDINAENFGRMFEEATRKSFYLLTFPDRGKDIILKLSQNDDSATRELFRELYDETVALPLRVKTFMNSAKEMWRRHPDGEGSCRQTIRIISTYLWLHDPDKYYIYQYDIVSNSALYLRFNRPILRNGSAESMLTGYELYNEIRKAVKEDDSVAELIRPHLSFDCYGDPELVTATIDVMYYYAYHRNDFPDNPMVHPDVARPFSFDLTPGSERPEDSDPLLFPDDTANDNGGDNDEPVSVIHEAYSKQVFLRDVFMDEEQYDDLNDMLLTKKSVILQGAPGVGKTYAAKKLAYSILGKKDDSRIEFVQFHQNCSYEDFVMGYRPEGKEFKLKTGVFFNFCRKAADDPSSKYVFIIDEINRGNMSRIFGELLMLIENDKRGEEWSVALAYGDDSGESDGQEDAVSVIPRRFFVPENVYIIGMMNTADRSLAMIDYALRRRFSFFEMKPAFDTEGFKEYQKTIGNTEFDKLINVIKELNIIIEKDPVLGSGFQIGHSYFCNKRPDEVSEDWMKRIVKYEIVPLLQEYWFDEPAGEQDRKRKWEIWKEKLLQAISLSPQQDTPPIRPETQSGGNAGNTAEQ